MSSCCLILIYTFEFQMLFDEKRFLFSKEFSQKVLLEVAPLRIVSKGHRPKESFPTRCVPSRAVI